ncbi:rhodanese-like domain-containing protein [Vannielia sp.]|uniref:rhodanese-like domain-containing protein n=1 Tax=Vannielia sp. TaxID=2813045 RepID=UPI002607AD95|nr:rhodanese-like domain-containing protein [Vannielia sp.]MDF1873597.1 rhodanese-like domain-containing protein [Vannielia sp.]
MRSITLAIVALLASGATSVAQQVPITEDMLSSSFDLKGQSITIERGPVAEGGGISDDLADLAQNCPPACIIPMEAAPGVATIGELEVIAFLQSEVTAGNGLLLDSRMPETFIKGAIPGAVNVPLATLDPENPYRDEILKALGAKDSASGWDFGAAKDLTLYCSGPWCSQAPQAIRHLVDAGYPSEKLSYYRGGLQVWSLLGLTVKAP